MANTKSARKRALSNEVRRQRNVARKSDLKTAARKVLDALATKNFTEAQTLLVEATAKMARARGKGVLKKNTASRKIGRLAKKVALAEKSMASS